MSNTDRLNKIRSLVKEAHTEIITFRDAKPEPSQRYAEDSEFITDIGHEIYKAMVDFSDACNGEAEAEEIAKPPAAKPAEKPVDSASIEHLL